MSKNIVICSDGTGNSAIKGRGTNVFKLFEAVDLNGHRTNPDLTPQVGLYDDGVGTEDFKPLKIFAGVTGFGLSRNVRQLYKELVRIYDPGDRIFLFGFSRGAFTARTLSGFIAACGILDVSKLRTTRKLEKAVRKAYKSYRHRYRTELAKLFLGEPDNKKIELFKKTHCLEGDDPIEIEFLGVWDTVDAVGLPFHLSDFINLVIHRFKFPDRTLNKSVKRACHALAIDDERLSFRPLLWEYSDDSDKKRIEQVWFAGAHSNVGGGYPKQGMSLVALDWMIRKAMESGLRVLESDHSLFHEHANVDDKLYNPRAGLGMFYRWKPRDIAAMCRKNKVPPAIHLSVLERIAHGSEDYAPGNLASGATVVITPTGDREKDEAACARAKEVENVLRKAHKNGTSLLAQVKPAIITGQVSYYVYLLSCVAAVIAASAPEGSRSLINPWLVLKNAGVLIGNVATLQIGALFTTLKQLATSPWLLGLLATGFLLSYLLSLVADRRMIETFSQCWHELQPELRAALRRARQAALAARD